jgi:hypothetical protein
MEFISRSIILLDNDAVDVDHPQSGRAAPRTVCFADIKQVCLIFEVLRAQKSIKFV